jgi:hypothetical protein
LKVAPMYTQPSVKAVEGVERLSSTHYTLLEASCLGLSQRKTFPSDSRAVGDNLLMTRKEKTRASPHP